MRRLLHAVALLIRVACGGPDCFAAGFAVRCTPAGQGRALSRWRRNQSYALHRPANLRFTGRRSFRFTLRFVSAVLAAGVIAAPVASGAGAATFPDKLKQRYLTVCTKNGKQAFCDCMLVQLEKRLSLTQMVRYVVALEHKRKPSKVIIRKVTEAATACIDSL
jgi:hypothetical protein